MFSYQVPGWDPLDDPRNYDRTFEGSVLRGFGGIYSHQFSSAYEYQTALNNQRLLDGERYFINPYPQEIDEDEDEYEDDLDLKEWVEERLASSRRYDQNRKNFRNADGSDKFPDGAHIVVNRSEHLCPVTPKNEMYQNDPATSRDNLRCWLMNVATGRARPDRYDFVLKNETWETRPTVAYVGSLYLKLATGVQAMKLLYRESYSFPNEASLSGYERSLLTKARQDLGDQLLLDAAIAWGAIGESIPHPAPGAPRDAYLPTLSADQLAWLAKRLSSPTVVSLRRPEPPVPFVPDSFPWD